mgnify:FL=1|jgi:hypothetical protein|tara:strand:- start:14189 stop:14362 length:174 start_codon:yes stop_codon:yes gene_type:complete
MDIIFLYAIDGLIMLSIFYACFCVKPKRYTEINISTPLKNDNYLNYEEVDIEALTTE